MMPWRACYKHKPLCPTPQSPSEQAGLGWGLTVCVSHMFQVRLIVLLCRLIREAPSQGNTESLRCPKERCVYSCDKPGLGNELLGDRSESRSPVRKLPFRGEMMKPEMDVPGTVV